MNAQEKSRFSMAILIHARRGMFEDGDGEACNDSTGGMFEDGHGEDADNGSDVAHKTEEDGEREEEGTDRDTSERVCAADAPQRG